MKKNTLLYLFLIAFTQELYSRELNGLKNIPIDIDFSTSDIDKPINVEFKNTTSGKKIKLSSFAKSAALATVRFVSNREGKWIYRVLNSNTELPIQDRNGTITVTSNDLKGQVSVDVKNAEKFSYDDGTPYHALAYECDWLFALDYKSANLDKTSMLLDDIAQNGFNQIITNLYAYDVKWKIDANTPSKYFFGKPNYTVFGGTNEKPDFNQMNLDYFTHVDKVMSLCQSKGLQVHMMIYVWNKLVNWPQMYSTADNKFFDYVINRYQAYPNMIWDISKEALDYGRCDINYINERIQRIRNIDQYKHLVTVHDYEYCSREPNKVDFISIQNWRSDLYSYSIDAAVRHRGKPVMNIEHGGYEEGPYFSFKGNYTNAETCLFRNYLCLFAGLYTSYYWQDASWNIIVYDALKNDEINPKPKYHYYKYLNDFTTKNNFQSLKAYKQKFTTNGNAGLDNFSSSGYCLTDDKGKYIYLLSRELDRTNIVIPKPVSGKVTAQWFNIYTGEYTTPEISDWWNWKEYVNPWKNQAAILIVEN
jgi:hypothetical protein